MSVYQLRVHAREDLEAIWDYTVEQWGVEQAEHYFASLFACFDGLAENPEIGRSRDDVLPGISSFPQGRQVVFYEINDAVLETIGIVHQSADLDRYF